MIPDRDRRIGPQHLARVAIVYPRQSSHKQVVENVESTRVQLNLREKAISLGWPQPVVIEEDLGVSATGFADRHGFQQMLTRVTMREVGIILCVDASRLSRNSKDWAQLFELCGYFDTLIADLDQVYDLSQPNDRLILGIKGTVAELELGILRRRLKTGTDAKAARGELRINLPAGYAYDANGQVTFDPDKRVQEAIHMLFRQFECLSSVRQLAMWYRDTGTQLPVKRHRRNGETTVWRVPTWPSLYHHLNHPLYAGAYVYGRVVTEIRCVDGKLIKRYRSKKSPEEFQVCLKDHHPGYISWEQYLRNREKISNNVSRWCKDASRGAIREGLALLPGILRCGRCGCRMHVSYEKTSARYYCDGGHAAHSRRCLSISAVLVDQPVSAELLRAVEPFALNAAIRASELDAEERLRKKHSAALTLQAAQYEADHTLEQFDLCDPKNRLVADTLEERLNAKLVQVQAAKNALEEISSNAQGLSEAQRQRLHDLAADLPRVWNHPQADAKLKKALVRCTIREVLLRPGPQQQQMEILIHWQGGFHSRLLARVRRPRQGNKADISLVDLVRQLAGELSDQEIARILNMKTLTTPSGLRWTQDRVGDFRKHHRICAGEYRRDPDHLTAKEAQAHLCISHKSLVKLAKMGLISRIQLTAFAPWRVSRAQLDSKPIQEAVRVLKSTGRLPKGGCSKDQLTLFDDPN